jgi:hypothetical protein
MLKSWSRQAPTMFVGFLLIGALFAGQSAFADHEPANKLTASGSETEVMAPGQTIPILEERVKVSSPFDVILSASAECDILTDLTTGGNGNTDTAGAFGQVRMFITIDDKVVPVSSDDVTETGKVVFCNRAHNKTVTDRETPAGGGTDEENDMTQTRQANAFNWLALDVGFNYDDPANGNNIVDIVLWAEFTEEVVNRADAQALVGHRTLIAEPTNASNHESVDAAE